MQNLNYCREMKLQFSEKLSDKHLSSYNADILLECMALAYKSEKFLMPLGGLAVDDLEMRALKGMRLSLPYECIALEYQLPKGFLLSNEVMSTKRIIFAVQIEDFIVLKPLAYLNAVDIWLPYPSISINRSDAIKIVKDGNIEIQINQFNTENYGNIDMCDYAAEATVLLSMLNALACSNVSTERSEPLKIGRKIKSALPFDAYHILTVCSPSKAGGSSVIGNNRSPREHLRRGHIRRLIDGRRIWVNATVVAAGRGAGLVKKDYAVRIAT